MAIFKSNLDLCNSLNFVSLVTSTVTLLLLLAGFLRIEFKLNDQKANLAAVKRLCTAQTQDVSQDDMAVVKGKTDDLCVFWPRCLYQNSLKYWPRQSLGFSRGESMNTPDSGMLDCWQPVFPTGSDENTTAKGDMNGTGLASIPFSLKRLALYKPCLISREKQTANTLRKCFFCYSSRLFATAFSS